jgi:glycosyltransferase involved in cell wall biosynthesis
MKKKVFLLHNIISPYRLPLFEKLSEEFDLDVKFCKTITKERLWDTKLEGYSFKNEVLRNISIGPLIINYTLPFKLLSNHYDAYIVGSTFGTDFSELVVLLISKLFKKPLIVWWSNIENYGYEESVIKGVARKYYTFYKKLFYRHADSFVAYGEESSESLIQSGIPDEKIHIGTQVISENLIEMVTTSKEGMGFANKKIILFVGYFVKLKGIDVLINGYKKIDRNDTMLIIAGAGKEENKLKSLAEGREDIIFPGYIQGKEKAKYYSIADIFVLPTLYDAWGLVINEAMMYGLPIITTGNAGCTKDLIKGNGFVVKAGDEEGLRVAIEKLLIDDELRKKMGIRSKEIIKKYNIDYAVNAFRDAVEYATRTK